MHVCINNCKQSCVFPDEASPHISCNRPCLKPPCSALSIFREPVGNTVGSFCDKSYAVCITILTRVNQHSIKSCELRLHIRLTRFYVFIANYWLVGRVDGKVRWVLRVSTNLVTLQNLQRCIDNFPY